MKKSKKLATGEHLRLSYVVRRQSPFYANPGRLSIGTLSSGSAEGDQNGKCIGNYVNHGIWSHINHGRCFVGNQSARQANPGDRRFGWARNKNGSVTRCPRRKRNWHRARLGQGGSRDNANTKGRGGERWELQARGTRSGLARERPKMRRSFA